MVGRVVGSAVVAPLDGVRLVRAPGPRAYDGVFDRVGNYLQSWSDWAAGTAPSAQGASPSQTLAWQQEALRLQNAQLSANLTVYQEARLAAPGWWIPWVAAGVGAVAVAGAVLAARRRR